MPVVESPCPFCADKAIDLCPRCGNSKVVRRWEHSKVDNAREITGKVVLVVLSVLGLILGASMIAVSAT